MMVNSLRWQCQEFFHPLQAALVLREFCFICVTIAAAAAAAAATATATYSNKDDDNENDNNDNIFEECRVIGKIIFFKLCVS